MHYLHWLGPCTVGPSSMSKTPFSPNWKNGRASRRLHTGAKFLLLMIFINEWLPNPTGSDTKGEFIELWNNGNAPVNLSGWVLETDNKKKFKLPGLIRANAYLLLPRSETRLSLKNTDGALSLYNSVGQLVDHSAFEGSAPEGESFNRVNYSTYNNSSIYSTIQQFVWGKPTPGAKNNASAEIGVSNIAYPAGISLNASRLSWFSVFGFAALAGVIFAAVLWYSVRKDENISELFFGGNKSFRR